MREPTIAPADNVPRPGDVVLDHVGLFVPDMERAAAAMTRLGFRLTPLTPQRHALAPDQPLVPAGTANRLAVLDLGYIELLTPVAATPIAAQLRAAIDRYTGLHLIALGTGDAVATHAHLTAEGFAPQPVIHLERTAETPAGDDLARFSVVRVPPGTMAEGRVQYCRHHTPHLVWDQRRLAHPNGARALTDLLVCVADPVEAAARYARFVGRVPHENALALERGRLTLLDPTTLRRRRPDVDIPTVPFMAAFAVEVHALPAPQAYLDSQRVHYRTTAATITAPLGNAIATTVSFHARGVTPPWRQR